MAKRKYRLRRSGSLQQTFSAENKSTWRNRDGTQHTTTTTSRYDVDVEYAAIYRGKGYWTRVKHPDGYFFPWRMPSPYIRGHQVIDLAPQSTTITWSTPFSSGEGIRTGVPFTNLLNRGDWSSFIESRFDMRPLLTYNELARHNVSVRLKVGDAKVNLSVFAAEMKKTATGLAKNFSDIVGIYRAVRKGDFRRASSFFKPDPRQKGFSSRDAAGRWLELNYAIIPLLKDIQGGYEYIRENLERLMVYSVSSNLKIPVPLHYVEDSSSVSMQAQGFRGVRTKVYYVIDLPGLREANRLGLINPLTLGWELVPYSFVIDWLLPVGNMLEAITATQGTQFISGTRTRWCDIDLQGTVIDRYDGYVDWPNSGISKSSFTGKIYSISREVLLDYPMVLPYVKNPFSTQHLINAVALVRNLFKR
ncbi:MAG: maturation protein [Perrunavirus faecadaptatum]|uniref:Maturation protein n=1 Tax=Leviviridae sp. TaxID=2027243 RepID=A0ABY3SU76_9VIRU|nr:MAG: maturation protein [Leviviridae sp.]